MVLILVNGIPLTSYGWIDKIGQLKRNKPISYFKLPFSEKIVLIAKIEKRIMKLKSSSREKKKI